MAGAEVNWPYALVGFRDAWGRAKAEKGIQEKRVIPPMSDWVTDMIVALRVRQPYDRKGRNARADVDLDLNH